MKLSPFSKILLLFVLVITVVLFISLGIYSKGKDHTTPIKIGINEWMGYDPFILADNIGFFKKNNVLVKIKRFASATDEMKAMKNGAIQGAGFTLDEVFSLVENGFKGKVVLIVDYSMGGDMIIGQKGLSSMADLAGKTVGYEGTVVGEFLLSRALQTYNIKKSSIKLINIQADKWLSTFKEKNVDALVCFNPVAGVLLSEYEGTLLFSSAKIPFEIIDVLLFSEEFYHANTAAITNILKAWFETIDYIATNPDKASKIIAAAKNINPDNYKTGLNYLVAPDINVNKHIFDSKSDNNIYKYSQVIVDFMMSKNMLSKRVNTTDLFEPKTLLDVQDSKGGEQ